MSSRMVAISGVAAGAYTILIDKPGEGTSLEELPRRVTRTPTLDGGAVIYDGGARHADRDLIIEIDNATRAQADLAADMWENQTRVVVTSEAGAFEGVLSRVTNNQGNIVFNVLVETKRS